MENTIKLGMAARDVMLLPGYTQQDRVRPVEIIDGGFRWFFAKRNIFFGPIGEVSPRFRITEITYYRNWEDTGET